MSRSWPELSHKTASLPPLPVPSGPFVITSSMPALLKFSSSPFTLPDWLQLLAVFSLLFSFIHSFVRLRHQLAKRYGTLGVEARHADTQRQAAAQSVCTGLLDVP